MGNIAKLKNALGIGARNNKYKVELTFPAIISQKYSSKILEKVEILSKNAQFPSMVATERSMWYQGRLMQIPGDMDYSGTTSLEFHDDENHTIRNIFIDWMVAIDDAQKHKRSFTNNLQILGELKISQLSSCGKGLENSIYVYENVYPKGISESSLSQEDNELLTFSVEFNYSNWIRGKDQRK